MVVVLPVDPAAAFPPSDPDVVFDALAPALALGLSQASTARRRETKTPTAALKPESVNVPLSI